MDLVNTVVLENGIEYTEIDTLECDNVKYMLYSNITNARDCCIRKLIVENNEKFLCKLDNDQEFDKVLDMFIKKNKTLLS